MAFTSVLCLSEVTILTKVKVKAVRTHPSFLVTGNKHTVLPVAGDGHRTQEVAFLISLLKKACMQTLKKERQYFLTVSLL